LEAVSPGSKSSAAWDSIHVFETSERARTSHYKLTSTVILHLANKTDALGEMNLSGNMTRQVESDLAVENDASHVANIGRLVEDMELKMRNLLRKRRLTPAVCCFMPCNILTRAEEVYFGKAKDVVGDLRSKQYCEPLIFTLTPAGIPPLTETNKDKANHRDVINAMNR
jgi:capping protein (actin filament) muscle Z-line, beta